MDEEYAPIQQSRTAFATRFSNLLYQYKRLLFQYWWLPLLTLGLSEGIQLFLLKHAPLAFVSVGRMIVNVKLSIPSANVYNEDLDNFFGTQVALMQSDSVINRVNLRLQATNPELHPVPVNLTVTLSPRASIFNLRAVGGDASYTQAYLQATMDEYINLKKELLANVSTATQSSMEEELKQMAVELQKSQEELVDYQSSNSVVFLQASGANSAADYLLILQRQLDEHESELKLLKTLTLDENLERLQGVFTQPSSAAPSNSVSQSNPAIAPADNNGSQNNTPANLGGFEDAYLQVKQQLIFSTPRRCWWRMMS
jgi:hypothetical protein